ncbi:efflux RND transporter periplasmic adaptor subunit [Parvularcula oceani]|uniref:efflux RND transporter periplasmic adaptor subunit n=1 Tax=Parvularcula oceani TaxID=1247963 RepID=UPI0004E1CE49|nr:efflux RND transporter periplasmic adaptor subunit [Parvularcula oceani]
MSLQRTFLALLALGLAACGGGEEAAERPEPEATRIVPHAVRYAADARQVEAVGTARARASAIVNAETGGEVEEVLFETGDFVEAGAPLLRLERDEEQLAVNLARVAAQEAEQLLERYRRIEDTGAVSDSAISEARTTLEAARIELQQAELALERRTVRAPFAGYLGLTDIDPGARITPETEITRLDDRRVLFVDFPVPEELFGRLSVGDAVQVRPFGAESEARSAEVIGLDSRIDAVSRSFTARAAIDNGDDGLRPGMSFRVAFAAPGARYPAIPEASIVWGSDGAYLWAVEDGQARRVPVAIVSRREGTVLVDAPLPEGSLVVAEGVQKVREGSAVELLDGTVAREPASSAGASGAAAGG